MRFQLTIDRDLLEKTPDGERCNPIIVLDTRNGRVEHASIVEFDGGAVVYGPQQQNGARVWVELDSISSTTMVSSRA